MDEFLQLSIVAIIVIVLLLWYLNKEKNNEGYGLDSSFINSAGSIAGPTSNIKQYIREDQEFMEQHGEGQ
jgi:hypothetical protein